MNKNTTHYQSIRYSFMTFVHSSMLRISKPNSLILSYLTWIIIKKFKLYHHTTCNIQA